MAYPVLQLMGITKVYTMGGSQVHALKGVDLEIHEGEMVSVMGPSGCGKSTMLQIAGCLDKPTAGVIMLSGTDVGALEDDAALSQGVSRLHAKIVCGQDSYYIVDLNSTNATYVNGTRLIPQQAYSLEDGDVIELGNYKTTFNIL